MNGDWPDLLNRRRPGGVSSLPLDGTDGRPDPEGGSDGDGGGSGRSPSGGGGSGSGSSAGGVQELSALAESPLDADSSSSAGAHSSGGTATNESAPVDPAVLAQVAALRNAASRGAPFCEE